jgi:uncharacterized protein YlaN (UPF0358 family)
MTHHDEELHRKAVELVRNAYDMADKMRKVNLDALNEARPPTMRYHAQYEVVMEFLNRAGAMLEFAGQLGLIDSEENGEILRSISSELTQWLEDEDKRLESEA